MSRTLHAQELNQPLATPRAQIRIELRDESKGVQAVAHYFSLSITFFAFILSRYEFYEEPFLV